MKTILNCLKKTRMKWKTQLYSYYGKIDTVKKQTLIHQDKKKHSHLQTK